MNDDQQALIASLEAQEKRLVFTRFDNADAWRLGSAMVAAAIVGRDARIEVEGDFYAPAAVTLVPRTGDPTRVESPHEGRGLRHQADEVARRLAAGDVESPLMPLDETISIMATMDTVLAQARQNA